MGYPDPDVFLGTGVLVFGVHPATAAGALLRKERRRLACETPGGGNFLRGRLTLRSQATAEGALLRKERRRPRLRNARRW